MAMLALEDALGCCEVEDGPSSQALQPSARLALLHRCSSLLSRPGELQPGFRADDPRCMLPHYRLQEKVDDMLRDTVRECVVDEDVRAVCEESCAGLSWSLPTTPAEDIREWDAFKTMKALLASTEQRVPSDALLIHLPQPPPPPQQQQPQQQQPQHQKPQQPPTAQSGWGAQQARSADREQNLFLQPHQNARSAGRGGDMSGSFPPRAGWGDEEEAGKRRKGNGGGDCGSGRGEPSRGRGGNSSEGQHGRDTPPERGAPPPPEHGFMSGTDKLRQERKEKNGGGGGSRGGGGDAGGSKKSLGGKRGSGMNGFIPPWKKKDEEDDSPPRGGGKSKRRAGGDSEEEGEPIDPRYKNIDPKMIEMIENEILDNTGSVTWDDIAGLEFAKTSVMEIVVWPMLRPDIFTGLRGPPKGLLLFGPPGTGKTMIGKTIASEANATFFSISASSLMSKWIGEGEKMVRALFAVARVQSPSVIFIDEIDSLLSQRGEGDAEASRRVKTEFLVQMDGVACAAEDRILLVGATNRPQELDEAARRRMVKRLYIPLPDTAARRTLVSRLMRTQAHTLENDDLDEVSTTTDGYSGADMKALCTEAAMGPIRGIKDIRSITAQSVRPISLLDFRHALRQVRASVSGKEIAGYLTWNKAFGSFPVEEEGKEDEMLG